MVMSILVRSETKIMNIELVWMSERSCPLLGIAPRPAVQPLAQYYDRSLARTVILPKER
jgi:hypothetical protein